MSSAIMIRMPATAESYRTPLQVTQLRTYRSAAYYLCPRCNVTIEREFMAYCDRCGQCLDWRSSKKATVIAANSAARTPAP